MQNHNEIIAQAAAADARPEFNDIDSGYSSGEDGSMEPELVNRMDDGLYEPQLRRRVRRVHRRQHDGNWREAMVEHIRFLVGVDVAEANERAQHMRREVRRQQRWQQRRELQERERHIEEMVAAEEPLHEPMQDEEEEEEHQEHEPENEQENEEDNEPEIEYEHRLPLPEHSMADLMQALMAHTRKTIQHRHAEDEDEEIVVD